MEEKEKEKEMPKRKPRTVRKAKSTIVENTTTNQTSNQTTEQTTEQTTKDIVDQKVVTTEKNQTTQRYISDVEVAKKLINIYQSAQDRKLQFNLSFEYVRKLLEYKTCYYTNKPFTEDGPNSRSFDRVDSDKGYIEGNVVACTIDINGKKSNLSFEEISCIYLKLASKKGKDIKKTVELISGKENTSDEFFSLDSKDKE